MSQGLPKFFPTLVPKTLIGAVNGVAALDASGKLPANQLPATVGAGFNRKGNFDASTGAYPSSPADGDFYVVSVAGQVGAQKLTIGDSIYYTTSDSSWHVIDQSRTTDELTEGTTNQYFTAARAQAAAVQNNLNASTSVAPSATAVNQALAGKAAVFARAKERYVLSSTDISNGYKLLANGLLVANSMIAGVQGLGMLEESLDSGSTGDYVLSVDSGTNKIKLTWKNDLAAGGAAPLAVNDVIYVQYGYSPA